MATATKGTFISVKPQNILNDHIGGSEKRMQAIFDIATEKTAETKVPTILFFDEADGILGKPGHNDCKAEKNIINIFNMKVDGVEKSSNIIVVLATNYKDNLTPAVLDRCSTKIHVELPTAESIIKILQLKIQKRNVRTNLLPGNYQRLAGMAESKCASGRDVESLLDNAIKRLIIFDRSSKFLCFDDEGFYVPCQHGEMCRGRGRKTSNKVEDKDRRLPVLSYLCFEQAIEVYGIASEPAK